jgi:hypothetical protein
MAQLGTQTWACLFTVVVEGRNAMRTLGIITALYCALVVSLGFSGEAKGETITFDDTDSNLAALTYTNGDGTVVKAAKFTFAGFGPTDTYVQHGMAFRDGVSPRDPRLNDVKFGHYHLAYEETKFNDPTVPNPNPENQPRMIASHGGGTFIVNGMPASSVIQMTYEPSGPDRRAPFNLIGLTVILGKLNVGVEFKDGSIAVANNLTPGRWTIIGPDNRIGANNLIRATLEYPFGGGADVDDIVFTPAAAAQGAPFPDLTPHHPVKLTRASPPFIDVTTIDFLAAAFMPPPRIDIIPGDPTKAIDLTSQSFPVAILTTKGFDATRVDPRSVKFGPNSVKPIDHAIKDKNLILHFSIKQVGFRCEDSGKQFMLFGKTFDGRKFVGSDFVRVTGCDFNENAQPQ